MSGSVVVPVGSALVKVLKELLKRSKKEGKDVITGILAFDFIQQQFADDGPFSATDEQTADGLTKAAMAIIEGAENTGIPIDGLKGRDGQPLDTNYIVIDIEKERIFPIFKYRSGKSMRAARRRGSWRGYGRARRSYQQNKYIYS
jgi:hypothetical protein